MPNQSTDVFPVFDHSSGEDETAKRGISSVDDQILIWSLLLQYIYAKSEENFGITRFSGTFIGSADSELSTIQRLFRARVIATYKNFSCKQNSVNGGRKNSRRRQNTSIQMLA